MLYETPYLEHWGIKGQKWGERRYRNVDGTLTEEGKKRYGTTNDTPYESESKTWKSKDYKNLDDTELQRRITRLQKEKQYKDLAIKPVKKEAMSAAKKIILATAVGALATVASGHFKSAFGKIDSQVVSNGGKFLKNLLLSMGAIDTISKFMDAGYFDKLDDDMD